MVFHELDTPPQSAYVAYSTWPRISGNGRRIVSAYLDPVSNLYRFRVINFDGSGGHEIDHQRGVGNDFGYFLSALSADGSTYARANRGVITVCSTAGGAGVEYLRLGDADIGGMALSDDGTKLYAVVTADAAIFGTMTVIQAGLWEFPVGGPVSARRILLGKATVAGALGIAIDQVARFAAGPDVALSQSGQRLVCAFYLPFNGSYWPTRVVAVDQDGSGIHAVGGTYDSVDGVAISADGSKVAILYGYAKPEATVMDFDGSNQRVIATGVVAGDPPISLTADGSRLCLRGGWLYRTDGVSRDHLFHTYNTISQANMRDGNVCMMARDGRHFSYVESEPARLNSLEIDPVSMGGAPDLTEATATPPFVVGNNGTSTTLKVRAAFPGKPDGVSVKVFEDGAVDTASYSSDFGGAPQDNGTGGDVKAGDGLYTLGNFQCFYPDPAARGPKTLRFAAQSRDSNNLRHSTIIDSLPFSVLASAPSGSAPVVTSLSPVIGLAGSRVTINGAGFVGAREFNVVTMNGHGVDVVSADTAGTRIGFEIPAWFVDGEYGVVVTANGQSSTPVVFTIGAAFPEITVEHAAGAVVPDGGSWDFGVIGTGSSTRLTFTIKNTGTADLTGLGITVDGPDASDFTVTTIPHGPVRGPNGSTTFTVQFASATIGKKKASLHIGNNVAGKNPYDIALTGAAYSFTTDTDGDGLNDGTEILLADLGFNWQVSQPALVSTLFGGLSGAVPNLNTAGFYTTAQVQAINVDLPLLTRNPETKRFKLTIGVEKSVDLSRYVPFPMTQPQTLINGAGKLEFEFSAPEDAAFFRLESR